MIVSLGRISATDLLRAHDSPAFLDYKTGVLEVEGFVPRDTIFDTDAAKVMLSKAFAAALDIHATNLDHGVEFITAGGAVEVRMWVTKKKVEFVLSHGTPREHRVSVHVVDTTVHHALLEKEVMVAMGRCYDISIESKVNTILSL